MYHQTHPGPHPLEVKLRKICRQLQQLIQSGKIVSAKKLQSLIRRRNRCLQKLMNVGIPLAKAGGAFAVATLFASQVQAQDCNKYHDANAANSLKYYYHGSLPFYVNLYPAFVDIDDDGDLDCYTYGESIPYFWKNVGTKDIPSYTYDYYYDGGFSTYISADTYPQFVDVDGDGDYDCFVPAYDYLSYTYYPKLFENVGTRNKPKFVENEAINPL